jgi:hypothetical protein
MESMSADAFDQFRSHVLADPELQRRLRDVSDWDEFTRAAVAESAGLGLDVDEQDVHNAHMAARRAWLERWI